MLYIQWWATLRLCPPYLAVIIEKAGLPEVLWAQNKPSRILTFGKKLRFITIRVFCHNAQNTQIRAPRGDKFVELKIDGYDGAGRFMKSPRMNDWVERGFDSPDAG
ncbi:hypothetical protein DO021_14500 [Desulfobacter hydrogenophilus]|uniref:Uncharacterized protein n=1 Tax=Desulfobacter hydrogenophilus TaxID=2291 RepID=A0A328FDV9_9BACT|nr:hypothetical protein [Desulfobacter hydrogenophilus]NDY72596.1 hypothetical protein [Desulfobacter hydrogenophilus]QBH13317.1 hypothetical protein EYB58_10520 [Desulfobacter hydrogenophilus]RAM01283.1 hypothetical protein DO021_14500 [Desulfobacter hydrogenophilus]